MNTAITHQETSSWTSWLNPFSYFGSSTDKSALGRNAPSKDFTKVLLSQEGKALFVATTPKELTSIITSLKKVSDDAGADFGKLIREGKDIPRKMVFDDMSEQSEVLSELRKVVPPRNEDVDPNEGKAPEAPSAPVYNVSSPKTQENFLDELKKKTKVVPPHTVEGGYSFWNPIGYFY